MEDERVVMSSEWRTKLDNDKYRNWLKVGYAIHLACIGIRSYVNREAQAFHGTVLAKLKGFAPCICTFVPRRRPNPHHDMANCDWAKELKRHHNKRNPTWSNSDKSIWMDPNAGFWEVAKLYMPFGCAKGKVRADETDATGLLNLLQFCDHFKTNSSVVKEFKNTRNLCMHEAQQELSQLQTDEAFQAIKDFLQDPELVSEPDAQSALLKIDEIENEDLIDFKDVESKVISIMKAFISSENEKLREQIEVFQGQEEFNAQEIKSQLSDLTELVTFCITADRERDDVLEDQSRQIKQTISLIEERSAPVNTKLSLKLLKFGSNLSWMVSIYLFALYLTLPRVFSTRILIMICLLSQFTLLEEHLVDFGCARETVSDPLDIGKPIFTEYFIRANTEFIGREWLFKNLTNFLEQESSVSKGVLLLAAPGFGKSAFIANLVCSKLSSYSIHHQILGYHMCIHSHKNTQDPAMFVQNMAVLISSRVPEYRDHILRDKALQKSLKDECRSDPISGFNNGILYPLLDLNLRFMKPMYIVVDALDECSSESDTSKDTNILNILIQSLLKLPKWLKIIATSRNIRDIRRQLSNLEQIELHPNNSDNLHDIERFIYRRTMRTGAASFPISIPDLAKKSQGIFLYVKLALDHFETIGFDSEDISLPESLSSMYQEFFRRQYGTDSGKFREPRRLFEILAAALSPLKVNELYKVLLMEAKDFDFEYEFMPMLEDLSMYLHSSPRANDVVSVFHSSLMEWLTSDINRGGPFYVDPKKGHRLLADYYLDKVTKVNSTEANAQFIYHMVSHIIKGGSLKRHEDSFLSLDPEIIRIPDTFTNATVLHFAAGSDHKDTLELVLNFFEDLDGIDINYRTPAFYSVLFDRSENLHLLHNKGASLFQKSRENKVKNQRDVDECKRQMCGYDLLHVASQKGHNDIVQYLLKNKADKSALSGTSDQAISIAAEYGHIEIMKTLLEHGAQLDKSCLYYASSRGHNHIVQFLLDKGIKDTCLDCSLHPSEDLLHVKPPFRNYLRLCNTALHVAAINDFSEVIAALLTKKDNAINCTNYYGKAPIHEAVYHNNYPSLEAFLKNGANPSQICKFTPALGDSSGFVEFCPCRFTPLHIAAYRGLSSIAHLLLQFNASHNVTNCEGLQPIHVAACRGYEDVVSVLVESGVDINSNSTAGMTPMHYACKCGAPKIFRKLFHLGADAFARSLDGKTAADYIFEAAHFDGSLPFYVDQYVDLPIDPINYETKNTFSTSDKMGDTLFPALINFYESLSQSAFYEHLYKADIFSELVNGILTRYNCTGKWMEHLVGSSQASDFKKVIKPIAPPFHVTFDVALLQTMSVDRTNVFTTAFTTALIRMEPKNCSRLMCMVENLWIYSADAYLDWGADVNCDVNGLTPILVYLRQGGRNMVKVLVKHKVTIDIKCGEYFEDSVFHLAAYHKLHYLQYLSVFTDSDRWERYLKQKDALFDYLFDEYEKIYKDGQVRITRVRDGPMIVAIKSHLRGFKIIDECLDDEGYTALQRAAQGANVVAVKHFLKWGSNASLESPEGFGLLNLTIWYAIKYRPRLNFPKPCLLTALETELASLTAGVILEHLTAEKPLNIGCDQTEVLTILHLAATRGMWRFIDKLFKDKEQSNVIGINPNCATKHGITPMYLSLIYGGLDCDWEENPWCKVVSVLTQHGGSQTINPAPVTEYFIIVNAIFHGMPEKFEHDLTFDSLLTLEESCGRDECFDFSPKTKSHLICEIRNGLSETNVDVCNRKENFLQDIANAIASKECRLQYSRTNFISFAKSSIKGIKKLIKQLLTYDGQSSCYSSKKKTNSSSSLSNADMCSRETVILLSNIKKLFKSKYKSYSSVYKDLENEVSVLRKTIEIEDHESQRYKNLDKKSFLYGGNHLCEWQTTTFKYIQLQFLVHALSTWNRHVRQYGRYPVVSKYAMDRIESLFFNENRKEFVKFIIALSKDNLPKEYDYLWWLRLKKPPLFETVFR